MAFNLSSLYLWKQLKTSAPPTGARCEWLSIWVLCIFENSYHRQPPDDQTVVNGFQFEFFVSLKTAHSHISHRFQPLWMAFNLSSLYLWKQLYSHFCNSSFSCEWLSIWVLCIFENSEEKKRLQELVVVNGFQFEFFVSLKTAISHNRTDIPWLWMAFNLSSLYLWKQRSFRSWRMSKCCEWLSIWVLCIFENSF